MSSEYIVQPGDTLRGLANRFGVKLSDLERTNPKITNPDLISPGEVIHIPARHRTYVVQQGDTLRAIADRFGAELSDLVTVNPQIAQSRPHFSRTVDQYLMRGEFTVKLERCTRMPSLSTVLSA